MTFVKSFFGLKLRIATKLIGWIDVVLTASAAIACFYALLTIDDIMESKYNGVNMRNKSPTEQKNFIRITILSKWIDMKHNNNERMNKS